MFRPFMKFVGTVLCVCISVAAAISTRAADGAVTNTPPYSQIFVRRGPGDFLGLTNVVIIHRAFKTVEVTFDVGATTDADGDVMEFHWSDNAPGNVVSTAVQFTNVYSPGAYRVSAEITDGIETVFSSVDFEVLSALDAMRLLVADLELTGRHEEIKHLRAPVRLAEKAMERRNWNIANRPLERFESGLTRRLNAEVSEDLALIERWRTASATLRWAIRKLPRRGWPSTPGGSFPGDPSGGIIILPPHSNTSITNIVPPLSIDSSNVIVIIEARRRQLLSNSVPTTLTNILPLTRFSPPTISNVIATP